MRSLRNSSLRDRFFKLSIEQNAASSALQEESQKQTCDLLHHYSASKKFNNQINLNNDKLSTWDQAHPKQDQNLQSCSMKLRTNFYLKRNIRVKKIRAEKNMLNQSLEYKQRLNEFDARPIFSISLLSPHIIEKEERGNKKIGQKRLRSKTIKAYLAYSSIPEVQLQASSNGEDEANRRKTNNLGSQIDKKTEKVNRQMTMLSTMQINNSVSVENLIKSIKQNKFIPKNAIRTPSSTQKIKPSGIFKKNRGQSIPLGQKRQDLKTQISLKESIEKMVARSPQYKRLEHLLSLEK